MTAHSSRKAFFSFLNLLTLVLLVLLALHPNWPLPVSVFIALVFFIVLTVFALSSYGSILCRCILPIILGAICVEGYVLIQQSEIAPLFSRYFAFGASYNEIFYSGLATLYALITALALVKGIEGFDAMKRTISDEAYKVRAIFELTYYFDLTSDPQNRNGIMGLRNNLMRYAANVAAMRDQQLTNENLRILRSAQSNIAKLIPHDANDHHALQLILSAHGELGVLRSKRINAVGEKIPRYLIAALWLMALALIFPFMAEPLLTPASAAAGLTEPDNPLRFSQYYIIFLLGALNSFLLLMLSDISDPFDGFWKVTLDPFNELHLALESEMSNEQPGIRVRPDLMNT
ncbi:MAG TPA: hypothetical protein VKA94_12705 [Hyphomicrobiales bacterium]|nr:hypothetical protein [Hyphomicrobiales bacterium]